MSFEDCQPCIYCGVPACAYDHIPPRAMRERMKDLGDYTGTWVEVPACTWCNSTLNDLALLTITDRKLYIKQAIRKKFKRLLDAPDWTDEAIASLGYTLGTKIKADMNKKKLIRSRLAW